MIYLALILAFALGIALAMLSREYTAADRIVRTQRTILERLDQMPTQADIDAAIAAAVTAFNTGFDAVEAAIANEAAAFATQLAGISGVPQEAVDAANAFASTIASKMTQAQNDIAGMIPAAAPAPTS